MSGTAHVLISPELFERLALEFRHDIGFIKFPEDQGDGSLLALVRSRHLESGYNGMQAVSITGDGLRFRPDAGT